MSNFHNPALKQLTDQQVRFAPPARRQEQLVRVQRLLAEIELSKKYPYQWVCFRITDFRPDSYPDLLIAGEDLRHDLYLFLANIARSLPPVPVEEVREPVLTLGEISRKLNVSPKTINRWRECGLVGRRVLLKGAKGKKGKRRICFPVSVVERFVAASPARVERGRRFEHLTDHEIEDILRRAKRLARVRGATLTEISRRIARRLGRSAETIRYTIKNFDRQHPNQALFPEATGPLDNTTKQVIFNSYRRGISMETLATRFHRTRTSMYRIVNEVRAERLLSQPLDYIYHYSFDDPAAEAGILAPMPGAEAFDQHRKGMKVPKDAPAELAPLYEMPLLNKDQEQHLFRQMNFLKHKASALRQRLDPARARIQDIQAVEDLQDKASRVKDLLINCNMRLVVSIAKRHSGQAENFFELLSDGNMSLIRAVEKFDYSRGNKFSTYASWAIMKNFARSIPEEKHHRERYVTGHEDVFDATADNRSDEQEILTTTEQKVGLVNRLLGYLEPREQDIIRMRAGLDNSEGMTLEEIGQRLGITKERVRQLNVRIMNKLRTIAKEQKVDLP